MKSATAGSPAVRLYRSNTEDAVFLQRRIFDIGFSRCLQGNQQDGFLPALVVSISEIDEAA
jgi:hypothetical protein